MSSIRSKTCLVLLLVYFTAKAYCLETVELVTDQRSDHDYNATLRDSICSIESAKSVLFDYKISETLNENELDVWQNISSLEITYRPRRDVQKIETPLYLGKRGLSLLIKYQAGKVPNISSTLPQNLVESMSRLVGLFFTLSSHEKEEGAIELDHCAWVPSDTQRDSAYVFCYWHQISEIFWNLKSNSSIKQFLTRYTGNKWTLKKDGRVQLEPERWILQLKRKKKWVLTGSHFTLLPPNDLYHLLYDGHQSEPSVSKGKPFLRLEGNVNVSRSVTKAGMHRLLHTGFSWPSHEVDWWRSAERKCRMVSIEVLSEDLFISEFEVEALKKFGGDQVRPLREIDIEKPSHMATQNVVVVSNLIKNSDVSSMNLTVPIHLRYQKPAWTQTNKRIFIPAPVTVTICGHTDTTTDEILDVLMATSYENWTRDKQHVSLYLHEAKEQPYQKKDVEHDYNALVIHTPVGNYGDKWLVKRVTMIMSFLGTATVIITSALKKKTYKKKTGIHKRM